MSERSGQTAKGKDGKTKYASLNLFDTYKGKSLETQKPVVAPRHGLQSLGKVSTARRMPPPANLPSLKAEFKGNNPNVSLVPKDGTGWASKQEPADPKSTDALSAPQPESQQPVDSQTPAVTQPRTPPAQPVVQEAPVTALQAAGARSWAQASVTLGAQGDGGKASNQLSPFSREEFPTLQAAGDQDRACRDQATADQWYGPGPSLRPQNVTSWRDGGGRALAPTPAGEGVAEAGVGGALVMEGAAGAPPLQQPNPSSHGPPRNPPAGSPALPLPQPPVGPQFPAYRGIMPPFMYPPYLPFPPPYGPQAPYRYPAPNEAPRFPRGQGGPGPEGRPPGGPRGTGEMVKRPSILKQDDLKELDELDHDGDEGWAGAHEEIDYSAKLKFSDDEGEEDGDEERSESRNGTRELQQQQRAQDGFAPISRSRASDSGGDPRHTPPASTADSPTPPSSKPAWAEEGGGNWAGQANAGPYQGRRSGLGGPREQHSPPPGPLLGQGPYSYYRQDRPSSQTGSSAPGSVVSQKPAGPHQGGSGSSGGGPTPPPPSGGLVPQQGAGEDEDETWRQRRKQSSTEISAAVERARRRREEEERRMEEERRAACAEKLKRLDQKQQQQQQQQQTVKPDGSAAATAVAVPAGSPSPSLSASSPNVSQPPSPCVDPEEPPLASAQAGPAVANNRQRAGSNSSYDSNTESQQGLPPPVPQQLQQQQQPIPPQKLLEPAGPADGKEDPLGVPHIRSGRGGGGGGGGGEDSGKVESMGGGAGRQTSGPPGQGYSKYQKSLPPRFQRQQQEQLMKQQQQWQQQQQQQQHSQAAQGQLQPQQQGPPQGPGAPGNAPQGGPKQAGPPLYPPGSIGRPHAPPLPMNFDPRWMMMPYMDPRMMQGRPPPMDYYPPNMHPSGLMGRERSDSGGSGSDPFDRQQQQQQQQHGGPPHPHRGTPPMDPKMAWGPEVFPGGGEGRGLSSPLRQKQALEEEDNNMGKGPRSDTPPIRGRDGGAGPMQQPGVSPNSPSGSSNQTPPPVGTQVGGPHHQPFMGGRGNYSGFPDGGSRMAAHQQQRGNSGGHGFGHQDEGPPRGGQQQGQMWGAPHPHYDRNGRADLSPLENSGHLQPQQQQQQQQQQHHPHPGHHPHFSLYPHKQENGRGERNAGDPKKSNPSPPLHQPSLSSSCSSSSSSSSAREDGTGKQQQQQQQHHHHQHQHQHQHHPHAHAHAQASQQPEHDAAVGHGGGGRKGDKMPHNAHFSQSQHAHQQQQQQHPKGGQRGREHKTETQWGPRPGSSAPSGGGPPHGRKGNAGPGEDSAADGKASSHTGGTNLNKRAGPIKRPVLKEMKREGGEGEGGEKAAGGPGREKEQDGGPSSAKQDPANSSQSSAANSGKDDSAPVGKPRTGGKDRAPGGKGPRDADGSAPGPGVSAPPSRRDRERSHEGVGSGATFHTSARGSRATRARGKFYGRGRGYRGSYAGSGGGGSSRGRAGGRSSRDFRGSGGGGYHQEYNKNDGSGGGRHGQLSSQHNPARARNRSETRSEGSEYEEIPKRRRQHGSETGSDSGASEHSEKDEQPLPQQPQQQQQQRKPGAKNGTGPENAGMSGGQSSSAPPRGSQARVFTPRGVPSRRGRGGGGAGGGIYRSGGGGGGGVAGGHRSASGSASSHSWSAKSSSSVRKQQGPVNPSPPKDSGRASGGDKKEKASGGGGGGSENQPQSQAPNPAQAGQPATAVAPVQTSTENGGIVGGQPPSANPVSNSSGPLPQTIPGQDGRGFPPRSFERPPRRRRHGRSQHQQDKPPRFRRLKQERENAARINGSGQHRSASPAETDGPGNPNTAVPNANHNNSTTTNATTTNSSGGGHAGGGGGSLNMNSHHHHHYNQSNASQNHPQHRHNHNPAGGAKSPDVSNQNSDHANEEWETASESSDFTEFREREGGGGGGKSYHHHHHQHHPPGRGGGGGGGGERDLSSKEAAGNKRSFSSQRPGMDRQNRRVGTGGGGRGPRGPPGGGGGGGGGVGGGAGNGGASRGEKRGNWPSPKNRK